MACDVRGARRRVGARSYSCRKKRGITIRQPVNPGVGIDRLEQIQPAVPDVPRLKSCMSTEFTLEPKAPFMHAVWSEFRSHVGAGKAARVEYSQRQLTGERGSDVRARRHCRQRICRCGFACEALQQYLRGRTRNVQVDVVERRIVAEAISATEDGFAIARQKATPLRTVGEPYARPNAVFGRWDCRKCCNRKRQCRIPEWIGTRLLFRRQRVKQVRRLAII